MKKIILPILLTALIIFQSCRDTIVINNPGNISYKEIVSINTGEVNFKLFITGADSLTTGYNDIFIKVNKGNQEQTTGYVKFFPKMWMTPTYMHSTAVKEKLFYDASIGYYKGYAIFNMVTNPVDSVIWYGVFTYVDENNNSYVTDSTPMYTIWDTTKQWRFFFDATEQTTYMLSMLKPFNPAKGMNELNLMLHKTDVQLVEHEQVNTAQMFLNVHKVDSVTVQSSGNINPAANPDGIYRGKYNLPYSGAWKVKDSIFYNNKWITNNPPPIPDFYFVIP